ncbi:MAG: hypothetical protein H0W48_09710 [Methylibium sp.]|nr:hypothetical protein [Methylibium sp.]MBA3624708.1 hypothetical protein [Methylibium sp.]
MRPEIITFWKLLFGVCLSTLHRASMAIEEPDYEIVRQLDGAEAPVRAQW